MPILSNCLAGRSVLVVEDEMMVLMFIEGVLADRGCEYIAAAATVDEALSLLSELRFDVAVLDVNLDGSNSFPVAEALVACGTPFLFATAYGSDGILECYGDRPFLSKPFQSERLVETIWRLLAGPSLSPLQ